MFTVEFVTMSVLAFGAYYLGIVIRKKILPGPDSLPLGKQMLLGIPVSLVVVPPLLAILAAVSGDSTSNQLSTLSTIGIIMEHGMLLNETFSTHLQSIINRQRQSGAA